MLFDEGWGRDQRGTQGRSFQADLIVEGSQRQKRIAEALAGLDAWAENRGASRSRCAVGR